MNTEVKSENHKLRNQAHLITKIIFVIMVDVYVGLLLFVLFLIQVYGS